MPTAPHEGLGQLVALLPCALLDERIHAYHLVGIALILAGVALTTRGHRADPEAGPE